MFSLCLGAFPLDFLKNMLHLSVHTVRYSELASQGVFTLHSQCSQDRILVHCMVRDMDDAVPEGE